MRAAAKRAEQCLSRRGLATAADRAQSIADRILFAQRNAVRTEIEQLEKAGTSDPKSLLAKKVELGYSDPKNHVAFASKTADVTQDVFATMHQQRWRSFLVPRLLKLEAEHRVIGDVLPSAHRPTVNLEVNFQNTQWLCAYGQPVPPLWTLYSPQITLTTNDPRTRHFTIAMVDIDRPDPDTKTYEEWCHWLVTDVPVTTRLVIPGGSSPLLQDAASLTADLPTLTAGADFVPKAPASPPAQIGNVIFPYVPAHPAASNPTKVHRYVLMVMEQTEAGSVKIDMANLKQKAEELRALKAKKSEPMWTTSVEGSGEAKLEVRERGMLLPITKFMKDHKLELKGHGFFTSTWNIHTPAVFSQLGIHEPVYGTLKGQTSRQLVKKITTATSLAASLPGPLATLSAETLKDLNNATAPRFNPNRLLTRRGMEVQKLRRQDEMAKEAAEAKKAEKASVTTKAGKKAAALAAVETKPAASVSMAKTPRLSALAAAALVRNKEGDMAKGLKGDFVRAVKEKRYRYQNV
ncbi:hypothetical protein HKX48_003965 [Thoreauomyces humboldtii]|nr:hypothetical protein HKX48_003965 [Thoreauomyces humboldtii]